MSVDLLLIHPNDMKAVYGDTVEYVACEPPFWCAVAAQYILDKKCSVKIIDAEAENLSYKNVVSMVEKINPVLVGIYVTGTNLSASTQKMQGSNITCDSIKEAMPQIPIYLWGLHPSALPKRTLNECKADYVVKGEGYETIYNLIRFVKGEDVFNEDMLGGLYYREDGGIKYFENQKLLETGELPMPAWELLPMDKYMPHNWHIMGETNPREAKGRYGVISTSIGCPFACSYCAIHALFGNRRVRFWKAERVVDEIERLVSKFNIKYIKILDENFVLNLEYVEEICDLIIKKNFDINMWAYCRVDMAAPELLKKMRRANIKWLAYGIESANDAILDDVKKSQYNREKTLEVMRWTKEAGINVIANFMFGLPHDTMETMERTFELSREINPEWINYYVTMQYPGSEDYMANVQTKRNFTDKWIQYAQFGYECIPAGSETLTPKEVLAFRDEAFVRFFENNDIYFENIRKKFGEQYVEKIKAMTETKLRRKLLGD